MQHLPRLDLAGRWPPHTGLGCPGLSLLLHKPSPPLPSAPAQKGGGQESEARAKSSQRHALDQIQAGPAQREGDAGASCTSQHRQGAEGQDAARPGAPCTARGQEKGVQGSRGLCGRQIWQGGLGQGL